MFVASAEAGSPGDSLVAGQPTATIDVNFPLYSTIDPISDDHIYAIQDIATHQVLVYHLDDAGNATPDDPIDLPADVTPSVLWWDHDGILHIETRELRSFTYCPECGVVKESLRRSPQLMYIGGGASGFNTDVLTDYGDMSSGSIWHGSDLDKQLVIPGIHPQQIDFSAYGKVTNDFFAGGFYVVPSVGSTILHLSDEEPPAVLDTYDGPAGAMQLGGIADSPLNLAPSSSGNANRPMFVSVPGTVGIDSGNVYVTDWQHLESGGGWQPISPTPIGAPTGLDATCKWVLVNDYIHNWMKLYRLDAPATATCDHTVDLLIKTAPKRQLTLDESIKAYFSAVGKANARFEIRSEKRGQSTVRAKAKVKLTAGRISHVNLKFSKAATAAVNEALASGHRLKGTTRIKVKDKGGHRVKVTQPLVLKAADSGKLVAKAG
jgi:hypothetical protein